MKRLKELREAKGLSQEALAKKLGVTAETINLWETGEKLPSDWEITLLLSTLDCSLPYLQGISDHNFPPSENAGKATAQPIIQVSSMYNSLPCPIICPRCGSRELAFVTEYHKAIKTRALELIAAIALCIAAFIYIPEILTLILTGESIPMLEDPVAGLVIMIGIYFIVKLFRMYIESKTHVMAICKDCGATWLHNYP